MIHMNLEASVDEWLSLTKTVNHGWFDSVR